MLAYRLTAAPALLAALAVAAAPADAQRERGRDRQSDQEWLEDCRDNDWNDNERYCTVRHFGTRPPSGALRVDAGRNGGVTVLGWDRDSVAVTARVQAWADREEEARAVAERLRIEADGGSIRASDPDGSTRWAVSYIVYVPRRTDLELQAHNGPVGVEDVSGRMILDTHNGPLSLRQVGGDVRGRTRNGPLRVELTGSRWEGRGLDAETANGPVVLEIPEGYSARLETGTVNGPMQIDFPIVVQGRITRRIEADLGQGGAPIRVVTTNGPVSVRRR